MQFFYLNFRTCPYYIPDNSLSHYFHFNISGLDVTENVLEAQLHLYRMRTPPHEMHPTVFMSPSLIVSHCHNLQPLYYSKRPNLPNILIKTHEYIETDFWSPGM
jgi:hypothetical protein